jgi:sugar transferase (PEP-CTERM/EpsH1 system associated)
VTSPAADPRPLVLDLVYRFDTGGLENGVVNLINHGRRYRHAVVALTEAAPAFCERVQQPGVSFHALHKPPGHGARLYPRLVQLFRALKPAVVHSRNLAALECQVAAWWAGVPVRVHGEHGRDVDDPDGTKLRYQLTRRLYRPFVHHHVALSGDLAGYLRDRVGVPEARLSHICNGVDDRRFHPAGAARAPLDGSPFNDPGLFVVGTVGRMAAIKAQTFLVDGFIAALRARPELADRLRLVLVGNGPLRTACAQRLEAAGLAHLAWLAGERADVPNVMRSLDCFVLPSQAEGISNTILEAMASALPVLATRVGGNPELVDDGVTGALVNFGDVAALAGRLQAWAAEPARARALGEAGRQRVAREFSLPAMVGRYEDLYDRLLARHA